MKRPRYLQRLGIPRLILIYLTFSCSISGILSSMVVSLGSIQIFNTHEWLSSKPTVYFHCKEGNRTFLPDVKETYFLYTFKGEESWQPLTELPDKKCKRCGLYEKDILKPDDVFDEWELCPSDFVDAKYTRFKEGEFNATFICLECTSSIDSGQMSSEADSAHKKLNIALVIVICAFASFIAIVGSVAVYRYWQKRKREQDQARFLKLFEEGDDIEDELELAHVI